MCETCQNILVFKSVPFLAALDAPFQALHAFKFLNTWRCFLFIDSIKDLLKQEMSFVVNTDSFDICIDILFNWLLWYICILFLVCCIGSCLKFWLSLLVNNSVKLLAYDNLVVNFALIWVNRDVIWLVVGSFFFLYFFYTRQIISILVYYLNTSRCSVDCLW